MGGAVPTHHLLHHEYGNPASIAEPNAHPDRDADTDADAYGGTHPRPDTNPDRDADAVAHAVAPFVAAADRRPPAASPSVAVPALAAIAWLVLGQLRRRPRLSTEESPDQIDRRVQLRETE